MVIRRQYFYLVVVCLVAVATDTFTDSTTDPAGTEIAAGSKFNALQFTYTAFMNLRGDTNLPDALEDPDVADGNDTAIDMSGGRIRIAFPSGWTVSKNYVKITDGPITTNGITPLLGDGVIYETGAKGKLTATFEGETATADAKAAAARVSLSDTSITIDLGKEWRGNRDDDVGRSLVIIFSDVQAGLSKTGNMFRSSASARGANLQRLAASPSVTVGNILGSRDFDAAAADTATAPHPDPLSRSVEISPARVYPGEKNHRFTITFKAPGPMDGSTLSITIPDSLQPDADPTTDPVDVGGDLFTTPNLHSTSPSMSVLARGGAKLADDDDTSDDTRNPRIADDNLLIDIATIKAGQTVVVTYTLDIIPAGAPATVAPATSAFRGRDRYRWRR